MFKSGMMIAGRYEIIEVVGSGGMSVVYKAKCHKLNRYVAIKVLKQEFSDDKNFVTKFRVEAQSAAGLSHPNIVNVFDVGEDEFRFVGCWIHERHQCGIHQAGKHHGIFSHGFCRQRCFSACADCV